MNFKSKMIEWAQRQRKQLVFNIVESVGTGYKKQYIIEVMIDNLAIARAQDFSIKGAEQLASEKAWTKINEESPK
jgi:ribonuclease-3